MPRRAPIALLYDDWDRDPYPTPFGPIPHDLAARLYYLERSASWYCDLEELTNHLRLRSPEDETSVPRPPAFVIGRDRDLPALQALGRVGVSGRSEGTRWDRKYILMRIWPFRDQRMQTQANSSSSDR